MPSFIVRRHDILYSNQWAVLYLSIRCAPTGVDAQNVTSIGSGAEPPQR